MTAADPITVKTGKPKTEIGSVPNDDHVESVCVRCAFSRDDPKFENLSCLLESELERWKKIFIKSGLV